MGEIGFMYTCTCKYCGDQGFVYYTSSGKERDVCPKCIKVDDKSNIQRRFEYKLRKSEHTYMTKFDIEENSFLSYVEDGTLYNLYTLKVYNYEE